MNTYLIISINENVKLTHSQPQLSDSDVQACKDGLIRIFRYVDNTYYELDRQGNFQDVIALNH